MDTLTSSEFRRRYASLTEPTTVTVNGHPIGEWIPTGAPVMRLEPPRLVADEDVVDGGLGTKEQQDKAATRLAQGRPGSTLVERYDTRPIRPVPKHR